MATVDDLNYMQRINLWCLPEDYQMSDVAPVQSNERMNNSKSKNSSWRY